MAFRITKSGQGIGLRLDKSTCSMLGETRKRCRTVPACWRCEKTVDHLFREF
uniref:Uncharacterized protein n=1 Tax=Hyaloperonospora arabidopsidis (strain Emoy2) TaxID=559515 RepID=M4B5P3_HYAAE